MTRGPVPRSRAPGPTVLCVVGTRPEAIKAAPVILELERRIVRTVVCSTGQHRALLDQALAAFGIRPAHELGAMRPGQDLSALTARLIARLDPVVRQTAPDWVVAQGDTTSVLAAALVAHYRGARFAHIEAGLRTASTRSPFPEEANRRIADLLAERLYAPTDACARALRREGHAAAKIVVTGNTVVDAYRIIAARRYEWASGPLRRIPFDRRIVLVTAHRREERGRLGGVCAAVRSLAARFLGDVHFVWPVHPNPEVREPVHRLLRSLTNVSLLPPIDYPSLVHLLGRSTLLLTDSGGLQEEAPSAGVPALVMRTATERAEGVAAGVARVVGTAPEAIKAEVARLLTHEPERRAMVRHVNPYGDGGAAPRIVDDLLTPTAGLEPRRRARRGSRS